MSKITLVGGEVEDSVHGLGMAVGSSTVYRGKASLKLKLREQLKEEIPYPVQVQYLKATLEQNSYSYGTTVEPINKKCS